MTTPGGTAEEQQNPAQYPLLYRFERRSFKIALACLIHKLSSVFSRPVNVYPGEELILLFLATENVLQQGLPN